MGTLRMSKMNEIVERWLREGDSEASDWHTILAAKLNVADDDVDLHVLIQCLKLTFAMIAAEGAHIEELPLLFFSQGLDFARIRLDVEEDAART